MHITNDNSISGTILTIFFSLISIQDIDAISKIVATMGTAIAAGTTCYYTIKKIQKLKDEKDNG